MGTSNVRYDDARGLRRARKVGEKIAFHLNVSLYAIYCVLIDSIFNCVINFTKIDANTKIHTPFPGQL